MITIVCIIADATSDRFKPDLLYFGALFVDGSITIEIVRAML